MLVTLAVAFLVGVTARAILPGRDPAGILMTLVVGALGKVAGSYLTTVFGVREESGIADFAFSVAAAVLALYLFRLVSRRLRLRSVT